MTEQKKSHFVDAFTISESFESLIDRHFRGRTFHRAEDSGPYAIEQLIKNEGQKLVRSRQEYVSSPSGLSSKLQWSSMCFEWEQDVFIVVMIKGNAAWREKAAEDEYRVTVTAPTEERAAAVLELFRKTYRPFSTETGPAFFLLTDRGRLQRANLDESFRLSSEVLALHYGEDFVPWAAEFQNGLGEAGISILRGEPGTGKTYFLRHLMCSLASTHRFFFVPVDAFGLFSSGNLTEFWKRDARDFPQAHRVLVLEDAEALLLERQHETPKTVSSILNLTDGLLTNVLRFHLICTLNCNLEAMDKALLRPGRLRFFRNFGRVPEERARRMAKYYKFALDRQSDYTLAELFASPEFQSHTSGAVKTGGPVGFGS